MVSPTMRETTRATYIRPATCSIMTHERAWGRTGVMSDSPTLVRFVNDRNSISNQVRGASGAMVALNEPGQMTWTAMKVYAKAQATTVNVAPVAHSSSVVTKRSTNM